MAQNMQAVIDQLKAAIAKNKDVISSAALLIRSLSKQIRDNADDPDELLALTTSLDGSTDEIAAAVVEGTSHDPSNQ